MLNPLTYVCNVRRLLVSCIVCNCLLLLTITVA